MRVSKRGERGREGDQRGERKYITSDESLNPVKSIDFHLLKNITLLHLRWCKLVEIS